MTPLLPELRAFSREFNSIHLFKPALILFPLLSLLARWSDLDATEYSPVALSYFQPAEAAVGKRSWRRRQGGLKIVSDRPLVSGLTQETRPDRMPRKQNN
jgi:hypothetical protein